MFDRFTERARAIIAIAHELAAQAGESEPSTTHLLNAMLSEPRGIAGNVLRERAVDAAAIEAATSACVEPDAAFSELATAATSAAAWLGHHFPGTEHLLLGLCNLPHSHAYACLNALDIPPLTCCQDVLEILGHHDDWDRWQRDHEGHVA